MLKFTFTHVFLHDGFFVIDMPLCMWFPNASYNSISFNSVALWVKSSTGFDPEQWRKWWKRLSLYKLIVCVSPIVSLDWSKLPRAIGSVGPLELGIIQKSDSQMSSALKQWIQKCASMWQGSGIYCLLIGNIQSTHSEELKLLWVRTFVTCSSFNQKIRIQNGKIFNVFCPNPV